MSIPLRFALPFMIVCIWAGWAAGGLHENRILSELITTASITHDCKQDRSP